VRHGSTVHNFQGLPPEHSTGTSSRFDGRAARQGPDAPFSCLSLFCEQTTTIRGQIDGPASERNFICRRQKYRPAEVATIRPACGTLVCSLCRARVDLPTLSWPRPKDTSGELPVSPAGWSSGLLRPTVRPQRLVYPPGWIGPSSAGLLFVSGAFSPLHHPRRLYP
jgi:hypothetical protein